MKNAFKLEGDILVHQSVLNRGFGKVGHSNIKIWGREASPDKNNTELDKSKDELVLYLCGHIDGFDQTEQGFMLTKERFIELAISIIKKYNASILKPVKLRNKDTKAIIKFLSTLKENDLVGEMENKAEVLKRWAEEFEKIINEKGKDIEIFLEFYE